MHCSDSLSVFLYCCDSLSLPLSASLIRKSGACRLPTGCPSPAPWARCVSPVSYFIVIYRSIAVFLSHTLILSVQPITPLKFCLVIQSHTHAHTHTQHPPSPHTRTHTRTHTQFVRPLVEVEPGRERDYRWMPLDESTLQVRICNKPPLYMLLAVLNPLYAITCV
jgi:hypothetical protein